MPRHAPASRAKALCHAPYPHHIEACVGHGRLLRALRYVVHRAGRVVPSRLPFLSPTAVLVIVGCSLRLRILRRCRNRHLRCLLHRFGQDFIMLSDGKLQALRKACHRSTQRAIGELSLRPLIHALAHFLPLSIANSRHLHQRFHARRRRTSGNSRATCFGTVHPPHGHSASRIVYGRRIIITLRLSCGFVRLIRNLHPHIQHFEKLHDALKPSILHVPAFESANPRSGNANPLSQFSLRQATRNTGITNRHSKLTLGPDCACIRQCAHSSSTIYDVSFT